MEPSSTQILLSFNVHLTLDFRKFSKTNVEAEGYGIHIPPVEARGIGSTNSYWYRRTFEPKSSGAKFFSHFY